MSVRISTNPMAVALTKGGRRRYVRSLAYLHTLGADDGIDGTPFFKTGDRRLAAEFGWRPALSGSARLALAVNVAYDIRAIYADTGETRITGTSALNFGTLTTGSNAHEEMTAGDARGSFEAGEAETLIATLPGGAVLPTTDVYLLGTAWVSWLGFRYQHDRERVGCCAVAVRLAVGASRLASEEEAASFQTEFWNIGGGGDWFNCWRDSLWPMDRTPDDYDLYFSQVSGYNALGEPRRDGVVSLNFDASTVGGAVETVTGGPMGTFGPLPLPASQMSIVSASVSFPVLHTAAG